MVIIVGTNDSGTALAGEVVPTISCGKRARIGILTVLAGEVVRTIFGFGSCGNWARIGEGRFCVDDAAQDQDRHGDEYWKSHLWYGAVVVELREEWCLLACVDSWKFFEE